MTWCKELKVGCQVSGVRCQGVEVLNTCMRLRVVEQRTAEFRRMVSLCSFFSYKIDRIHYFMAKHFRHQDTKTQRLIFTNSFALCLCALVAIFPVYPR
jgi:hypothetical protein